MPEDPTPPQDPSSDPASATRPPSKRRSRRRRRKRGGGAASQIAAQPTGGGKGQAKTLKAGKSGKKPAGKGRVQKEVSAGGVVYRREGEDIEVVLASRRTRRGDLAWGLAKGGIEPGETKDSLGDTKYFYVWEDARIRKTVHFFLMRHTGGDTTDRDDEMEEVKWFPLDRALKRAAYRGERDVLKRAADLLR